MKRSARAEPLQSSCPFVGRSTAAPSLADLPATSAPPPNFYDCWHGDETVRAMHELAAWVSRCAFDELLDAYYLARVICALRQVVKSCPHCEGRACEITYPYLFVPFVAAP